MIELPPLADLLVIGGLTIDRFGDATTAPGGSVLHAGRAAAAAQLRTIVVTVAGPEPVAARGLAELDAVAELHVTDAPSTISFRHRDAEGGRRLWLEADTDPIQLPDDAYGRLLTAAILFAPVAGEVPTAVLGTWEDSWMRGAILQGWLRRAGVGEQVDAIPPSELPDDLASALGSLDVLVASREDLAAAADTPVAQIDAIRRRVGKRPVIVVTDGAEGAWIDIADRHPRHLRVPWRVDGVPTVGAGDAFAALFVARLAAGAQHEREVAATGAMRSVAEMLEGRRI